ncbi:hypothetical protein D9M68_660080 [compost metagenome]
MHDAVAVDVTDAEYRRINLAPLHHPLRQFRVRRADQVLEELILDQRSQCRRGHVQQRDAEYRPSHRVAGLPDGGRGVEARQDMRQAGGAYHQAEHKQHKVEALGLALLLGRRGIWLGGRHRMPAPRKRVFTLQAPLLLRGAGIAREFQALAFQRLDFA